MTPLFGKGADAILESGAPTGGRIVGIRTRMSHDDEPIRIDEYAVEAGGTVLGIRQQLNPSSEVRLGMTVQVRVDGKSAVIDWGDVLTYRWKMVSPPAPGIEDDRDGLGSARTKWLPATVVVEGLVTRKVALGLVNRTEGRCTVAIEGQEPYELMMTSVEPAFYASHLLILGSPLPAFVNPGRLDRVRIDWAAAALADPGIGRPAALEVQSAAPKLAFGVGDLESATPVVAEPPVDLASALEGNPLAASLLKKLGVKLEDLDPGGKAPDA